MGRYYNGDIEGKFWFAVQSSTDADFFGVSGQEPNYVEYYFGGDEEDIMKVREGIAKCLVELGTYVDRLDAFFDRVTGYDDVELGIELELMTKEQGKEKYGEYSVEREKADREVKRLLEWYARLKLGMKIEKCLTDNGSCSFTAEL